MGQPGWRWTAETNVTWSSHHRRKPSISAAPAPITPISCGGCTSMARQNDTSGGMIVDELSLWTGTNGTGTDTAQDGTGLVTGRSENWGQWYIQNENYVAKSSLPTPTSVALPPTPTNNGRTIYDVQQGTGNDAQCHPDGHQQCRQRRHHQSGGASAHGQLLVLARPSPSPPTWPFSWSAMAVRRQYGSQLTLDRHRRRSGVGSAGPEPGDAARSCLTGCNDGINEATALRDREGESDGRANLCRRSECRRGEWPAISAPRRSISTASKMRRSPLSVPTFGDRYYRVRRHCDGRPQRGQRRSGQWPGGYRHRGQLNPAGGHYECHQWRAGHVFRPCTSRMGDSTAYQALNLQCIRETDLCGDPFLLP